MEAGKPLSNAPLGRRLLPRMVAWSVMAQAGCLTPASDPAAYEWVDPDGDKALGVPAWLEVRELHFRFSVPGDTYLYESLLVDVYTDMQTQIEFNATPRKLTIVAPLVIDVLGPINEGLTRVEYDFATGEVAVTFSTSDVGWDWQTVIKDSLQDGVASAIAGTRMAKLGYNPSLDPNIAETLSSVAGGMFGGATSGRSTPFDMTLADQLGVRASFFVKEEKSIIESAGNGILLFKGNVIELESDNDFQWPEGSNLQALMDASGTEELVAALGVEDLTLRSFGLDATGDPAPHTGFQVISKGKPVAHLQDVRIIGDVLELRTWFLAGAARDSAVIEKAFLGLFFGLDPQTAEARADKRAGIVKGLVSDKLENGLSVALRRLVYKHRAVIGGIDLPRVLGMSPPPPRVDP